MSLSRRLCPKTSEEKEQMSKVRSLSVVGTLMYAMLSIKFDLYHVVVMASRYQSNPSQEHWKTIKRILQYLKGISH